MEALDLAFDIERSLGKAYCVFPTSLDRAREFDQDHRRTRPVHQHNGGGPAGGWQQGVH